MITLAAYHPHKRGPWNPGGFWRSPGRHNRQSYEFGTGLPFLGRRATKRMRRALAASDATKGDTAQGKWAARVKNWLRLNIPLGPSR